MWIRVFTVENYMDLELKQKIDTNEIVRQLEEGNQILVEESDGSLFILNCLNIVGIKVLSDEAVLQLIGNQKQGIKIVDLH